MIVLPPIVGVVFFFVCIIVAITKDVKTRNKPAIKKEPPFDEAAYRRARGMEIEKVNGRWHIKGTK